MKYWLFKMSEDQVDQLRWQKREKETSVGKDNFSKGYMIAVGFSVEWENIDEKYLGGNNNALFTIS